MRKRSISNTKAFRRPRAKAESRNKQGQKGAPAYPGRERMAEMQDVKRCLAMKEGRVAARLGIK